MALSGLGFAGAFRRRNVAGSRSETPHWRWEPEMGAVLRNSAAEPVAGGMVAAGSGR